MKNLHGTISWTRMQRVVAGSVRALVRGQGVRKWSPLSSSIAATRYANQRAIGAVSIVNVPWINGDGHGQTMRSFSSSSSDDMYMDVAKVHEHISLMEHWNCSGCGIELQEKDPKAVGYLPPALLERIRQPKELKKLRCERCHQMTNYGKISDAKLPYKEYERRVAELQSKDLLMIQLVDILDISGSLLSKSRHLFGNKPVMLVVNKGDMVPEKSGLRRLMRRITAEANAAGVENILSVYLVSAKKSIGIKEVIADINKHRQGRDICVVGAANVGKSTFLNSLMTFLSDRKWQHNHRKFMKLPEVDITELSDEEATDLNLHASDIPEDKESRYLEEGESLEDALESEEEDRQLTTSPLPGTTLAIQHLPVMVRNELFHILDTPGLITDTKRQKLVEVLAKDGSSRLKNVFPTSKLPVTTYRISPGRSLFLGALARFDFASSDEPLSRKNYLLFTWYGVLPGHLTSTERAEDTFVKHAGGVLAPPRGLDALSYTGPLHHYENVYLKDYMTESVETKSKHVKQPKRTSVVELELPSFGWLTITAVDLDGTQTALQTLRNAKIVVSTCRGLSVKPRAPLFPFEMSKSTSSSWKT